jgi:hypothetical protein
MDLSQKTQGTPPFLSQSSSQLDFVEQYWVAQYFGNRVLRAFLRICPWYYRQSSTMVSREWKRAHLGRADYRSVEWMVRRYGVLRQETVSVRWLRVTYAEWCRIRHRLPEEITGMLFSESLRRHVLDVEWSSTMEDEEEGRGPSFIEANCRFSVVWPDRLKVPRGVRPFVTEGEQTMIWMQPPGVISQEALRLFFSVFSALTGLRQIRMEGLYEAEMNFGPYQVFGLVANTLRQILSEGIYGIYYDAVTDTVWIVDFYFGAVYNYLYRMLQHSSR